MRHFKNIQARVHIYLFMHIAHFLFQLFGKVDKMYDKMFLNKLIIAFFFLIDFLNEISKLRTSG